MLVDLFFVAVLVNVGLFGFFVAAESGPVLPPQQPVSVLSENEEEDSLSDVGASNTAAPAGKPAETPLQERPLSDLSSQELIQRIELLEDRHNTMYERLSETGDLGIMIRQSHSRVVLDERSGSLSDVGPSNTDVLPSGEENYGVGYDGGFYFKPDDKDESPFSMTINGRMQARYIGFSRLTCPP